MSSQFVGNQKIKIKINKKKEKKIHSEKY